MFHHVHYPRVFSNVTGKSFEKRKERHQCLKINVVALQKTKETRSETLQEEDVETESEPESESVEIDNEAVKRSRFVS